MKKLFLLTCLIAAFLMSCNKKDEGALIENTTITILHSTCVKTIFKIENPTVPAGVDWADNTTTTRLLFHNVAEAGNISDYPTSGLEEGKQYKVKIYSTATGPQAICYMLDAVNSPSAKYDIRFLP